MQPDRATVSVSPAHPRPSDRGLRLGQKFTLVLAAVFLMGIVLAGLLMVQVLQKRAEDDVVARGRLLTGFEDAVRDYTNRDLTPILLPVMGPGQDFMMQTVPTFATKQVFALLNRDPEYRDYRYKPAVLNPTNPQDLADDEEAVLVQRFRADPNLEEVSGYRTLEGRTFFYSASPIVVTSEACLACHSTPEVAPPSLVAQFGNRGFGWQLGSIVGAQIVYVPASEIFDAARRSIFLVLGLFVGILAVAILLINLLLRRLVVNPVDRISALAARISGGEMTTQAAVATVDSLDPIAARGDELGQSARVVQQMARDVYAREQALRQQVQELKIEIDHARREREVGEIVESEFFRDLQSRAERMRRPAEPGIP